MWPGVPLDMDPISGEFMTGHDFDAFMALP